MRPPMSTAVRVCARCRRAPPSASFPFPTCTTRGLSTDASSSLLAGSMGRGRAKTLAQTDSNTPTPTSTRVPSRWLSQSSSFARSSSSKASDSKNSDSKTSFSSAAKPPETHYDFFPLALPDGPPPWGHFPIDQDTLRREFLQLQAKAHPDKHPRDLKARAEATSARINEAYKTLSSPLLRAQYLLSLRGIDVANDETLKIKDPELLMSVLEAREAIEDVTDETDLKPIRAENDERLFLSEKTLEDAFAGDDIETAKGETVKLRYWVNIKDSLDGWEKGKPVVLEH